MSINTHNCYPQSTLDHQWILHLHLSSHSIYQNLGLKSGNFWSMYISWLTVGQLSTNFWPNVNWASTKYWLGWWWRVSVKSIDRHLTMDDFRTHDPSVFWKKQHHLQLDFLMHSWEVILWAIIKYENSHFLSNNSCILVTLLPILGFNMKLLCMQAIASSNKHSFWAH